MAPRPTFGKTTGGSLGFCLQGPSACWCRVNMAQVYMNGEPWSCAVHNLRTIALLFHYSDFSATLSLAYEISLNPYLHGFPVIPFFSLTNIILVFNMTLEGRKKNKYS